MTTLFPPLSLGALRWDFSRTLIMGVVNVTPDSFYDGGRHATTDAAVAHALALAGEGADLLDVGGESTRPGAAEVSEQEELDRIIPVIEALTARCGAPISVDTYKARVAREAVAAGAAVINDISGMALDPEMVSAVVDSQALVILGHLRGAPASMNHQIHFIDVVTEVITELRQARNRAVDAGVPPGRIWIDPGIGFGKTAPQSLSLLRATGRLREEVGQPILVGPSRKSFIGEVTGQPAEERLMGTCAAVAAVIQAGADAVRVHDVAALGPAVQVADAIRCRGEEGAA